MKDEVKAARLSFILHPSAFILSFVGMTESVFSGSLLTPTFHAA
jgi:hypothetical protein